MRYLLVKGKMFDQVINLTCGIPEFKFQFSHTGVWKMGQLEKGEERNIVHS